MTTHYVDIVETATGKREKRMGPMSERKAEKVDSGANRNLNHERFHTEINPVTDEEE